MPLRFSSFNFTSSSSFSKSFVFSVDFFKISETPIKTGLLFSIIQLKGEIDTSQLVNANNPSIVLSGETPLGK